MRTHVVGREKLLGRRNARRPPGTEEKANPVISKVLEKELAGAISGEVRFDDGSRALYATDGSNYRQVPIGVVIPKSERDVLETLRICRQIGAPVLSRGGGTSLAGQCCNVAVVIDWSKYLHQVLEIDVPGKWARVQPGTVLDDLRQQAVQKGGLTFGPDPATHTHCTLGGMIGNNSCGMHAQMAGPTSNNVIGLEVLTYDGLRLTVGETPEDELSRIIAGGGRRGELYAAMRAFRDKYADLIRERYPKLIRRISGYNLDQLLPEKGFNVARALVGSEGTLVTILEAKVRLVANPKARSLLVLGYPDIYQAADHVPEVVQSGPIALEGMDEKLLNGMQKKQLNLRDITLLPQGKGWLLLEFGGDTKDEADEKARALMATLKRKKGAPAMSLFDDPKQEKKLWDVRESGLGATARIPGEADTWEGWEDAAVPPEQLGDYLRKFRKLLDDFGYACALYGHFGQGCVHTRIDFDLETRAGIDRYRAFIDKAADLVVSHDGSLSGEHGDGQSRAELLPKMFGEELVRAMGEFKAIWDPGNKMNPHKVVDAYRPTDNLRFGTSFSPPEPATHFSFPEDQGSFVRATTRCVGVGKCRREGGGTMCPSYMVTREEKDSTRGRAHLLFEMLQGDPVKEGWKSEAVKDALDLCLACKGCKGDCPMNVDMASYKAEFLSHYYQGRRRPRYAYAFGLIMFWARLGTLLPAITNLFLRSRVLSPLAKLAADVAPQREIPLFASKSFQAQVGRFASRNPQGERVILFPDTFNNFFHPENARAALAVLERAGFKVEVPQAQVCCGRPLYDYGMLDTAKWLLQRTLQQFQEEIRAGASFVVLEPSCAAVFRDELRNLFPHDEDAMRLSRQTFVFSEFVAQHPDRFQLPKLDRKAIVQGHCHHKSVLNFESEQKVLEQLGLEAEIPESGCCGMAGAFGFEKDHYGVSIACGERVILPKVREVPDEALVIADGFSCHEQITQGTGRTPMHLAQVMDLAARKGAALPERLPEAAALAEADHPVADGRVVAAVAGAAVLGAAFALRARRSRRRTKGLSRFFR